MNARISMRKAVSLPSGCGAQTGSFPARTRRATRRRVNIVLACRSCRTQLQISSGIMKRIGCATEAASRPPMNTCTVCCQVQRTGRLPRATQVRRDPWARAHCRIHGGSQWLCGYSQASRCYGVIGAALVLGVPDGQTQMIFLPVLLH